jgi:hypothetical protein
MPGRVERYQAGLLREVELTEDAPCWESYSMKLAESEAAVLAVLSVIALRVKGSSLDG